jgi:hypothetical protein
LLRLQLFADCREHCGRHQVGSSLANKPWTSTQHLEPAHPTLN